MGLQFIAIGRQGLPLVRIFMYLLLFIVEVEAVEIALRSYYVPTTLASSVWAPVMGKQLYFFNFVVTFPAILLLLLWPRLRKYGTQFMASPLARSQAWPLAFQLLAYSAFATLTYFLSVAPEMFAAFLPAVLIAWCASLIATVLLAMLVLASPAFWIPFVKQEWTTLAIAALAALLANFLAENLPYIAPVLATGALHGAGMLLGWFFDPIVFDVSERVIGTTDFSVIVSNDCAGYEGIALISIFSAVYLRLFRAEFRFPQALLVIPIGICIIWFFNIVRIAVLIAIGDAVSPAVALAGFHSNAGWIAFIAVSLLLLAMLHQVPYLSRRPNASKLKAAAERRGDIEVADALLMPFITLLGAALLLGAITSDFDWSYPLKVLATGAVLGYFWKVYQFVDYRFDMVSPLIGVGVFVMWMFLVQPSDADMMQFSEQITTLPAALAFIWLAFRFIGSVVTVPLAEEFAFRGYLLAKLGGGRLTVNGQLPFSLFALLVSSILFGLMHTDWLAGCLAGIAYAGVRYRRGQIGDAVVAHMTTNGLLSLYVLLTGHWSYW